jgi:hypothetical protein
MPAFTLEGVTYEYLRSDPGHPPEDAHSWTYGQYPKVTTTVPLVTGMIDVYSGDPVSTCAGSVGQIDCLGFWRTDRSAAFACAGGLEPYSRVGSRG